MPLFRVTPDRDRPPGWLILRVFDIPFYIEPSFLIMVFLVFMVVAQSARGSAMTGNQAVTRALLLVFVIFISLLVHEAGHAIVSRLYGLAPITVSLIAFGGATRHPPTTHGRSLAITLAGPAGSLLMAGVGWYAPQIFPVLGQYEASQLLFGPRGMIFFLNLIWLIFNLLPIYPMDGGQSLFHIFSFFTREPRALFAVAWLSLGMCALLGVWMLLAHSFDWLILIFLIMFAQQNIQIVRHLNHRI